MLPRQRCSTPLLTHGDVGQLVGGAMRVDAVQVRPITVQPTEDQRRADVALIPEQHQTAASGFSAAASVHPAGGGCALLSSHSSPGTPELPAAFLATELS